MPDVRHDMHAFVILGDDEGRIRLDTNWSWSRDDPAVVTVLLSHPTTNQFSEIMVSRENLVKAALRDEKAGEMDCVIDPMPGTHSGDMLLFHLASYDEGVRLPGHQHLLLSAHSMRKMLTLTLEIVPQEFEHYDMDALIERWLS